MQMNYQECMGNSSRYTQWRYYNNAVLPCCAPHETPCTGFLDNNSVWKTHPFAHALFARWTSDFDWCQESSWWYVIKDTPFDINQLKSKRRYEINKGNKFFDVRHIDPLLYQNELYEVQLAAFSAYPEKYRPVIEKADFIRSMDAWKNSLVYGAFFRETGAICGYSVLLQNGDLCLSFSIQKTVPAYEKYAVNAALVYKILMDSDQFIREGGYICDGERSINHETAFQDYLEKYFGFRKAYCRLHMKYRPWISVVVKTIYPLRDMIAKFDQYGFVHKINAVLRMEEISRECKR